MGGPDLIHQPEKLCALLHPSIAGGCFEDCGATRSAYSIKRACEYVNSLNLMTDEQLISVCDFFAAQENDGRTVDGVVASLMKRCGVFDTNLQRALVASAYLHKFPEHALCVLLKRYGYRAATKTAVRACATALRDARRKHIVFGRSATL